MSFQCTKAVIVGAGMSGILIAIKLIEEGITDFKIIEKGSSPGGTWRDNKYPGLQCDVPAYMYTYSFEPNPSCSRRYAEGRELKAYFEGVFNKYGLADHTVFNTTVASATWDETSAQWQVKTDQGLALQADLFFCATGVLYHPNYPDIPGLESFSGTTVHSARWDDNLDLNGKKVGIVGTGSTSVQIISAIYTQVESLKVFQRTPHWVVPALDKVYARATIRLLQKFPALSRLFAILYEKLYDNTAGKIGTSRYVAPFLERAAKFHLRRGVADETLRQKLTPDYKAGCKRLIMSDHFYTAMSDDRVELVCEGIKGVNERGIETKDQQSHEFDVLILATGFKTDLCLSIDIQGKQGQTLKDAWSQSAYGYKSLMVPGFPNFFVVPGPHSPFGNFSFINVAETQMGYVLDLLKKTNYEPGCSIDPKEEVTASFNKEMSGAVKNTIWSSGCKSWYLDKNGNPMLWPWSFTRFKREMKQSNPCDYHVSKNQSETARHPLNSL